MGEVPEREDGDGAGPGPDERDGDDNAPRDERDGRGAGDHGLVEEGGGTLPPLDRSALVEVLEFLAKGLVDEPDAVVVQLVDREGGVTLRLTVDQPDMGKVIGRAGRTARAIRTLMRAAGTRAGVNVFVEIVEE
jgi:predicted RNA-binding protein YlqC (UPF0109 family)